MLILFEPLKLLKDFRFKLKKLKLNMSKITEKRVKLVILKTENSPMFFFLSKIMPQHDF